MAIYTAKNKSRTSWESQFAKANREKHGQHLMAEGKNVSAASWLDSKLKFLPWQKQLIQLGLRDEGASGVITYRTVHYVLSIHQN